MKLALRGVEVSAEGAQHARRSWPVRQSLLVRLTDASGGWGLGEAAPLPGYSPENLEDAKNALESVEPAALAQALGASDVWSALSAAGQLLPSAVPSARFALESAALDLLARRRHTSAPALLGASKDVERPLAALLGPASSPTLLADAERAFDEGYRCFKLKVGAPGALEAELAGAAQLRERFGDALALRLDANGALTTEQLSSWEPALAALRVELFEEPGGLLGAAAPLAVDESLQGLNAERAEALWSERAARGVVLKPTTLGGLSHCWHVARRAERAGLVTVVSHCFEGPIAWRAAAALALALPGRAAQGLAPHGALKSWPAPDLPVMRGSLQAWSAPGLGYPAELAFP
ncbi:MAG: hypothetical protein EOO73_09725 [Myxococcales bacterium]|nr:MAG: hypothetical protein EOO73_09725 [Myxococcales bacterium]